MNVVSDPTGQPTQAVVRTIGRLGRVCVGIEIGPEDSGRGGWQEVFVDNGFRRIPAVVVGQAAGGHFLVGGGEVVRPHRGGVGCGHRGVVALTAKRRQRDAARLDLAEPHPQRPLADAAVRQQEAPRLGEVEARGVALTPKGRERYDAAMAAADPASVWHQYFPPTDAEMAAQGLAYYRGGDPSQPVVYEDFLPASAAGIFRSNLDRDSRAGDAADDSGYDIDWLAGAIGREIHDPYTLYEEAAS